MTMLKTTTIAACVLALSGSAALAQMMPPGTSTAPGGTGGMSRSDDSSGAQMQYGAQPQGQFQAQGGPSDNPRTVAITDEYGNQYNSRGDKIGRGRPAARQPMR
jgi:hypothetical protein